MKKRIIAGVICSVLLIAGCSDKVQEPVEEVIVEPTVLVIEETVEEEIPDETDIAEAVEEIEVSEVIAAFHTLLKAQYTSVDIAKFIEDRIDEATPSEAEYMIQYLLLYQTEYMIKGDDVLIFQGYMDALNDDMDGILDASKIKNIANETIRKFYQDLSDSYLTIVRYEETPVVETDWTRIDALNTNFSEGFEYVVSARSYNGDIDYLDYYDIAERTVALEKMIALEASAFVKHHMLELYDLWSNYLVVGPEGTHIDSYITKVDELYKAMLKFSSDDIDSEFGALMQDLVNGEYDDYIDVYDVFDAFTHTNDLTEHQWIVEESNEGESTLRSIRYFNRKNKNLTDSINAIILSSIDEVIAAIDSPATYKLEVHQYYASEEKVTLLVTASFELSETERAVVEKYLNIDLQTGRSKSLSQYLQVPNKELLALINKIAESDFTMIPSYELSDRSIYLKANNADSSTTRFVVLSYKELIPYIKEIPYPVIEEKKTPEALFEEALQDKLNSDMSIVEYVEYLEESIEDVSIEEAEKMIEALMIFQTETIIQGEEAFNQGDYREAYFAFDEGELSLREIKKIEDEETKDFYLWLYNSYLTINPDEDILELGMNWERIEALDATYSEAFAYIVETRSDNDLLYDMSYYDMAKKMVKLEVLEDKVTSPFVKGQLEELYDLWAGEVLIGPMGDNYGTFVTKSDQLYEALLAFSISYPESELGQFIDKIDAIDDVSYPYSTALVNAFILSENIGQGKWTVDEVKEGNSRTYQLVYQEIGNSEISEKVNTTISKVINDLKEGLVNSDDMTGQDYTVESLHLYKGYNQVTLYLSIDYETPEGKKDYKAEIVSIDLSSGEKIGFDSYLSVDEHEAIAILNELLGLTVSELPELIITKAGVLLKVIDYETNDITYESISKRVLQAYINK